MVTASTWHIFSFAAISLIILDTLISGHKNTWEPQYNCVNIQLVWCFMPFQPWRIMSIIHVSFVNNSEYDKLNGVLLILTKCHSLSPSSVAACDLIHINNEIKSIWTETHENRITKAVVPHFPTTNNNNNNETSAHTKFT